MRRLSRGRARCAESSRDFPHSASLSNLAIKYRLHLKNITYGEWWRFLVLRSVLWSKNICPGIYGERGQHARSRSLGRHVDSIREFTGWHESPSVYLRTARQCINQLQITADSADHDLLIRRRASTGRMTERKLECCFYSLSVFHLNERLTFRLFTMIGFLSVYY